MNMQDQIIYFHKNGKPGKRFMTGSLREKAREKERRKNGRKTGKK